MQADQRIRLIEQNQSLAQQISELAERMDKLSKRVVPERPDRVAPLANLNHKDAKVMQNRKLIEVYKRKLAAFGITDIKQEEDRLKFLDAELAKLQEEQTSLEKIKRGQQKRLEELTVPDDGKAQIGQAERARVQEQKQLHEAISRKEKEVAKLHYSCITKQKKLEQIAKRKGQDQAQVPASEQQIKLQLAVLTKQIEDESAKLEKMTQEYEKSKREIGTRVQLLKLKEGEREKEGKYLKLKGKQVVKLAAAGEQLGPIPEVGPKVRETGRAGRENSKEL